MIDTHAHITCDELFPEVEEILIRAKEIGIEKVFNIATDIVTLERGIELQTKYSILRNIAATTPHDVEREGEIFFPLVEKAAYEKKIIAIGETGLDYFYEHSPKEIQKAFFRKYIKLAIEADLPLVIHCRDAFSDLIKILDEHKDMKRVLIHCFTGTLDEAKKLIQRSFYISFSGIVTYKKSVELQETMKHIPLEQMTVETDSPYLAPHSKRGKVNEPSYIYETFEKIATLRGVSVEDVVKTTSNNVKNLFNL